MTSADEVFARQVTDPLSEVTRSDRRWLLLVNIILAAMAYGGIVPSEIEAFGLKTAQINRGVIFVIVWVVGFYLAVSFTLYVATDFKTWEMRMREARQRFIDMMLDRDAVVAGRRRTSGRSRETAGVQPSFRRAHASLPAPRALRNLLSVHHLGGESAGGRGVHGVCQLKQARPEGLQNY